METKTIIWILLWIFLLCLFAILSINIPGFGWDLKEKEVTVQQGEISIESFDPEREIYGANERAYMLFTIKNTLGIPYNVTVSWINNKKRYFSWFNRSTEQYKVTEILNPYESWLDLSGIDGDWDVQLIVEYTFKNFTFKEEHTRRFKVI